MKLFFTAQIAGIDRYTIEHEPVSALDLMERASARVADWLTNHPALPPNLLFFAGPGNNGGDALAVARIMAGRGADCRVYVLNGGDGLKPAVQANLDRLGQQGLINPVFIRHVGDFPIIGAGVTVVDGLFGAGLNRPLSGVAAELVRLVNGSGAPVVAIDIPSGLMGEDNTANHPEAIIRAAHTLTFEFPKLSFLFPENEPYVGEWQVLPIGLHPAAIRSAQSDYRISEAGEVAAMLRPRSRFAHKGHFGHALLIAGAYGKMGAAVLAARACLHSGVGLLTTHVPNSAYRILQVAVPESMCSIDASDLMFTEFPPLAGFDAVGVGPGLGTKPNCQRAVRELLLARPAALVADADALNILAANPQWLSLLPENAILTPHPKEFERLAGPSANSFVRLQQQISFSQQYQVIVVLKGAFTSISFPDGQVVFNPTGNPGMATAGSGDVLTGMITGLLAQGYQPAEAAVVGVFLHGLAGDAAAAERSQEALVAGDLVEFTGKAFLKLKGAAGNG